MADARKELVYLSWQNAGHKAVYFNKQKSGTMLKQPTGIKYLLKKKHRGAPTGKQQPQKGGMEEEGSCHSEFLISFGNLNLNKLTLIRSCCKTEQWDYQYCLERNYKFLGKLFSSYRVISVITMTAYFVMTRITRLSLTFWSYFIWLCWSSKEGLFWQ